jgi:hypothetical protein
MLLQKPPPCQGPLRSIRPLGRCRDQDVWDVAAIAAFFGMSNRLANFASPHLNDGFYALGRS